MLRQLTLLGGLTLSSGGAGIMIVPVVMAASPTQLRNAITDTPASQGDNTACESPPASWQAEPVGSVSLKLSTTLLPPLSAEETTRFLMAEQITGSPTQELQAVGQAEMRMPGTVLKAAEIRYNTFTDTLYAEREVRLYRDGNFFTGDQLSLKLDTRQGELQRPEFVLPANNGRGQARSLTFLNQEQTQLKQAEYSTCPANKRDWYVRAEELTLDAAEQQASGKEGTLYFKDVPILYLPRYRFGLGEQRRTGFLAPYFSSSSRSGFQLTTPFYINLAPNRDLTLLPRYYTRRGEQLGADFRYLGEQNRMGQLRAEYLPKDQEQGRARYSYSWQHAELLAPRLTLTGNFNQVSDDTYFTDFSRTLAASSQSFLPRDLGLSYLHPTGTSYLRLSNFQTLQNASTPITPPYARLPQVGSQQRWVDWFGLDAGLTVEATRFSHSTLQTGERYLAIPSLSYPLTRSYGFVVPKVSLHTTYYALDANSGLNLAQSNAQREVPIYSLDSGLIFERSTSLFGNRVSQTLEPRLFYLRAPYRNQSNLPNFDSALADINFAQIFAENAFSGQDRVADADQLTTALTTRFITDSTGQERLRLAIAQRFNFQSPVVTLPGGSPSNERKSDLLFAGYGQLSRTTYLDSGLQLNAQDNSARRYNTSIRYIPARGKSIAATYRYREAELRQVDIAGQWPLTESLYAVGRVNYSLLDRQSVENVLGVEYNGGCWIIRAVGQRFASAANTSTTSFFLQLELSGFGALGSNPSEILRRNIPGYSILNNRDSNSSRFTHYE
ncbi:LPS-assembly protein LptD [Parvibium lacunae]|nr:LPS-assembly protein LptD [Parvibium lacunae]